jgi:hypothetical protein
LRDSNTGALQIYNINNNRLTGTASIAFPLGADWQFAGVAPISAAGASDLVLRNVNSGEFQVYNIASNSLRSSESLGKVGPNWQLGGFAATTPTKARAPIRIGHDETALLCGSPDVRAERLCCQPREGRAPASYPNHIDLHGPDSGRENENPARVLVAAPSL